MAKCNYPECDEILDYLPFKCRYCGGTYCKIHRLPENHKCSFELQIQPQKKGHQDTKSSKDDVKKSKYNQIPKDKTYDEIDKEMRNYIREQERAAMPPPPSRSGRLFSSRSGGYSPFITRANKPIGTYSIMGMSIFFFLISLYAPIKPFILLNINYLLDSFLIHFLTIFTSIFTTTSIISLIFTLLILYWSGKVIELQMGTKFLMTLYILSGLANGFVILFLQSIGLVIQNSFFLSMTNNPNLFSTQNGAYYGLMVFLLYRVGLDREMRFYLYFIPIRMKARYILYFIIGINVIFGGYGLVILLLGNAKGASNVLLYLPQLAGILVGTYFWKRFGRQIVNIF